MSKRDYYEVLGIARTASEADVKKGKCIECLACELTCFEHGCKALRIDLPMPVLNKEGGAK